MPQINYLAILLATVAQFAVGAIWYMPLFGRLWGKIHGFDTLDKKTQQRMQAEMGPYYAVQFIGTCMISLVLSQLIVSFPQTSPFLLACIAWFGFVLPTQVSAVIFGGTEPKWIIKKAATMAGGSLACLLAGAAVLSWML